MANMLAQLLLAVIVLGLPGYLLVRLWRWALTPRDTCPYTLDAEDDL